MFWKSFITFFKNAIVKDFYLMKREEPVWTEWS